MKKGSQKKTNLLKPVLIGIQNYFPFLISVVDPFLQNNLYWQTVFYSAIGLYGIYMVYNIDEVREVIQFINDNPKIFSEKIVKTKAFEKGFLLYLENYFKQRIKRKKIILNKILLGYASEEGKVAFELERLNDAAVRISLSALACLDFLEKEIIPIYASNRKNLRIFGFGQTIEQWLYDKYRPESPSFKKIHPEISVISDEQTEHYAQLENTERIKIMTPLSELVSLDIVQMQVVGGAYLGGGAGADYKFTDFGIKFMEYNK